MSVESFHWGARGRRGQWGYRTRLGSIRSLPVLVPILLILLLGAALGAFVYRASVGIVERQALRTVGLAASGREASLLQRLESQRDRAEAFLRFSRQSCLGGAEATACLRQALEGFVTTEGAEGALLRTAGQGALSAGTEISAAELEPARGLASFGMHSQRSFYLLRAAFGSDLMVIRFSTDRHLAPIFAERTGLGEAGESFLADERGFFVTPSRWGGEAGHSHPIHARPMQACLGGADGEVIDLDYRGVKVVHGFRRVEQAGGGCIMAHVDHHEALAPARALGRNVVILAGGFLALAIGWSLLFRTRFSAPLDRLNRRAESFAAGDFASRVPVEGPAEVRAFASAFAAMAGSVEDSRRRLEEAVRQRDEFLSVASHELRTPLTTLKLISQSLLRQLDRGEWAAAQLGKLERALGTVDQQVDRLDRLIEDMLDVSRLRTGRLLLRRAPVDLAELVRAVLLQLEGEVEASGSKVELRVEGEVAGQWDAFRLEQVFTSLLANALKFGEGKPIRVGLERAGATVRLSVRDQGVGIAPEKQGLIFEPFERAVPLHHYGGLGLGLYLVKKMVEAHGGWVQVESQPGRGSTFTVTLPVEAPPP